MDIRKILEEQDSEIEIMILNWGACQGCAVTPFAADDLATAIEACIARAVDAQTK